MEPQNEQGVIVEFTRAESLSGYHIVSIQAGFPDAIVERNGIEYRAEFEYKTSNFVAHSHDPRDCDIIICWENDLGVYLLPTLELRYPEWYHDSIKLPTQEEQELAYWKIRGLASEYWRSRFENLKAMIETGEVTISLPKKATDDLSKIAPDVAERNKRIIDLYKQGVSLNKIQSEVFGFTGGSAFSVVKGVIYSATVDVDEIANQG